MKKRYLEGSKWSWTNSYTSLYIPRDEHIISLTEFHHVSDGVVVDYDDSGDTLLEPGYKGMMYMPNDDYCLSVIYNRDHEIVEWYFDIIDSFVDSPKPYVNDLYIDIAVSPQGLVSVLDEDELIKALEEKIITSKQYQKALQITDNLLLDKVNDKTFMKDLMNTYYQEYLLRYTRSKELLKKLMGYYENAIYSHESFEYDKLLIVRDYEQEDDYLDTKNNFIKHAIDGKSFYLYDTACFHENLMTKTTRAFGYHIESDTMFLLKEDKW